MATMKVTGTVIVRIDGVSIRSKRGAKLNIGGVTRTPIKADGEIIGYSEEPEPSMLTCTLAHTSSSNLTRLRDTTDGAGIFEADTGKQYSIQGLFCTKPPEITGGEGDVAVEFAGQPAVEL